MPIWWLETLNGRPMPLDPRPHPAGNVIAGTRSVPESSAPDGQHRPAPRHAIVLGAGQQPPAGTERYVPHFATCARRPRRRGERECALAGCGRLVDRAWFMCGVHWRQVPATLRATVLDFRSALQRGELQYRRDYLSARRGAIAYVLSAEAERAARHQSLPLAAGVEAPRA